MGFLGETFRIRRHQGDGSGGTDNQAHFVDHFSLVKTIPTKLEGKTVREKRKMRPQIRQAVRNLMGTAEETGGDPTLHRNTAVDQINHWLPPYLRISAKHIHQKP